ncbi:MAG: ATP-binding cassette domain-containing protein [Devosiaceae bacterium]
MSFDRIQSVLKRYRSGEDVVPSRAGVPNGEPVFNALDRVAGSWFGTETARRSPSNGAPPGVPTPEELRGMAADSDIALTYEERALGSLAGDVFPCILLMTDGSSLLVSGRDEGVFLYDDGGGTTKPIEIEVLERGYSGTVFHLRPQAHVGDATGHGVNGAASIGDGLLPDDDIGDAIGLYRKVLRLATTGHRSALGKLGLAAGLSNMLMLALPLFTMAVYDRVIPHGAMETLWALSIGVVIALGVDLSLRFVRGRFADAVSLKVALELQAKLYGRMMGAKLEASPRAPGGLSRLAQEIEAVAQAVPQLAVSLMIDVPFFLLLLVLLYSIGGPVLAAPLFGLGLLSLMHIYAHSRARSAIEAGAEFSRLQSNQLVETLAALPMVKTSGASGSLMRSWERVGDDAGYEGHTARLWLGLTQNGQMIVTQFVIVLTLMIGAYQVSAGMMSVGALAASTLLVGRALTPIAQMIAHGVRLLHLKPSADVLAKLLDSPQEIAGENLSARRKPLTGAVQFSGVSFAHPGAARHTLHNVSFSIARGERVALIGRIGSGKSTLLHTMLRLHEVSDGSVQFDGADARQFAPEHIRRSFGYMTQDNVLFDVSLREAITLGLGTVSDDDFERAVTLSGVHGFASQLPQGYATPVGPRGSFLSGGERQAVSLARVLAMNPSALLLDEPTASMDNTLEAQLIENLRQYLGGRTLIVATHRAALLSLVDRVIWLDQGKVMADGPREDVLARINGGGNQNGEQRQQA